MKPDEEPDLQLPPIMATGIVEETLLFGGKCTPKAKINEIT